MEIKGRGYQGYVEEKVIIKPNELTLKIKLFGKEEIQKFLSDLYDKEVSFIDLRVKGELE
jgi:hypothetical protein